MGVDVAPAGGGTAPPDVSRIAGLPILKGLLLYGATATFVAIHLYFVIEIWDAKSGAPPHFNGELLKAGAALAGVLGSAFALYVGLPTRPQDVNQRLAQDERTNNKRDKKALRSSASISIRKFLSLEPPNKDSASWPLTGGIWAYACVAGAVAVTYAMNANETPADLRTIAVAFGGYVIALVTAAFATGGRGTA